MTSYPGQHSIIMRMRRLHQSSRRGLPGIWHQAKCGHIDCHYMHLYDCTRCSTAASQLRILTQHFPYSLTLGFCLLYWQLRVLLRSSLKQD